MNKNMLTEYETTQYKAERLHMLQYPGICQLFILACIGADAFTLFSIFDLLITQQKGITWVITITVAAAMNIAPMLLAACLRNDELKKNMKILLCTILTSLFIMLFGATFSLRYSSQEQLYGSTSDLGIEIQNEDTSPTEDNIEKVFEPTTAQNILAVILGLEPLATSICSFVLAYEVSPKRKRLHLINLHNIELKKEIDQDIVMIQELIADMKFDLDEYDRKKFEEMMEITRQVGEMAKDRALRKLAEHGGSPEDVSYLMERGYLGQQKDAESVCLVSVTPTEETASNKIQSIA